MPKFFVGADMSGILHIGTAVRRAEGRLELELQTDDGWILVSDAMSVEGAESLFEDDLTK